MHNNAKLRGDPARSRALLKMESSFAVVEKVTAGNRRTKQRGWSQIDQSIPNLAIVYPNRRREVHRAKTKMAAAACTLNWFPLAQHHDCHDFGIMARRGVLAQTQASKRKKNTSWQPTKTAPVWVKTNESGFLLHWKLWYFFDTFFFFALLWFYFYIFLYLKNDYWLKISMNVIVFFYK